jgi:hypothetical protein
MNRPPLADKPEVLEGYKLEKKNEEGADAWPPPPYTIIVL